MFDLYHNKNICHFDTLHVKVVFFCIVVRICLQNWKDGVGSFQTIFFVLHWDRQ